MSCFLNKTQSLKRHHTTFFPPFSTVYWLFKSVIIVSSEASLQILGMPKTPLYSFFTLNKKTLFTNLIYWKTNQKYIKNFQNCIFLYFLKILGMPKHARHAHLLRHWLLFTTQPFLPRQARQRLRDQIWLGKLQLFRTWCRY